jgi:hypothetical protein
LESKTFFFYLALKVEAPKAKKKIIDFDMPVASDALMHLHATIIGRTKYLARPSSVRAPISAISVIRAITSA